MGMGLFVLDADSDYTGTPIVSDFRCHVGCAESPLRLSNGRGDFAVPLSIDVPTKMHCSVRKLQSLCLYGKRS